MRTLRKLVKARRELSAIETKTREFARNTASAAEFIADTVRAESRHFAFQAVTKITNRLTGFKHEGLHQNLLNHDSLEALGGVAMHPHRQKSSKKSTRNEPLV